MRLYGADFVHRIVLDERLKPRLVAFRQASACADASTVSGCDPSTQVDGWPQAHRRDFNRLYAGLPRERSERMPALSKLIAQLGVSIRDLQLLQAALTHGSYANEHVVECGHLPAAERLEFLGDAVLNFETANLLFARFPEHGEGELSELRAALVKTSTLAGFARHFNLGAYIRMNKGEESSGARKRDSLLADTFEAMLAAIYLDAGEQGLQAVRTVLTPLLEGQLEQIGQRENRLDYRSRLQEYVQATQNLTPRYEIVSAVGPDHRRTYTTVVLLGDQQLGQGVGNSKQSSAQEAARETLRLLEAI